MFFSIAGTYRRDDSVDVRYTVDDEPRVATGLDDRAAWKGQRRRRPSGARS